MLIVQVVPWSPLLIGVHMQPKRRRCNVTAVVYWILPWPQVLVLVRECVIRVFTTLYRYTYMCIRRALMTSYILYVKVFSKNRHTSPDIQSSMPCSMLWTSTYRSTSCAHGLCKYIQTQKSALSCDWGRGYKVEMKSSSPLCVTTLRLLICAREHRNQRGCR